MPPPEPNPADLKNAPPTLQLLRPPTITISDDDAPILADSATEAGGEPALVLSAVDLAIPAPSAPEGVLAPVSPPRPTSPCVLAAAPSSWRSSHI